MLIIWDFFSVCQTDCSFEFLRNHRSVLEKIAMGWLHCDVSKLERLEKIRRYFVLMMKFIWGSPEKLLKNILYSFSMNRDYHPRLPWRSHVSSIKSNYALAKSKGGQSVSKRENGILEKLIEVLSSSDMNSLMSG